MKVVRASTLGMCGDERFGVKRSIQMAEEAAIRSPHNVYMLGEIVHNQVVVERLKQKHDIRIVKAVEEIPENGVLIIRAHGAVPGVYNRAIARNLKIVDATCPIVASVHRRVLMLAKSGKKILYVASEKNHDEAIGVAGEVPASVQLTTLEELNSLSIENPENTVVITQTTLSVTEVEKAFEQLRQKYPALTFEKHICMATTERQRAISALKGQGVEIVIVVGSSTSSNGQRLVEVAKAVGMDSILVNRWEEISKEKMQKYQVAGVTAAASTPSDLVDEVVLGLEGL